MSLLDNLHCFLLLAYIPHGPYFTPRLHLCCLVNGFLLAVWRPAHPSSVLRPPSHNCKEKLLECLIPDSALGQVPIGPSMPLELRGEISYAASTLFQPVWNRLTQRSPPSNTSSSVSNTTSLHSCTFPKQQSNIRITCSKTFLLLILSWEKD